MNLGPTKASCGDTVTQYQPIPPPLSHSRLLIFILQHSSPVPYTREPFCPTALSHLLLQHRPFISIHPVAFPSTLSDGSSATMQSGFYFGHISRCVPLPGSRLNSDVKADFVGPSTAGSSRHEDDLSFATMDRS